MIISSSLAKNKDFSYIKGSFSVFKPNYLFEKDDINRWKMSQNRDEKMHKGEGFSDHLPIFALFSTNNSNNSIKKLEKNIEKKSEISSLYKRRSFYFQYF